MNNAINEIKNTLEPTNSRITEAEDRISEFTKSLNTPIKASIMGFSIILNLKLSSFI